MILSTITLNPAIDKTYYVDDFAVDGLNRAKAVKTNMGGKGVNVAAVAAACGISCIATGFLSGYNGQRIGTFLKEAGVTTDFVFTEGETRVNIKIIDTKNQCYTDVNENGPAASQKEIEDFYQKALDIALKSDMVYMGGSFHPSLGKDFYYHLITRIKEKGAKTILDADGDALLEGIKAKPDIIKPNQAEAERLLGKKIKTVNDALAACAEIHASGIDTVLLSIGGNGAVAATREGLYRAYPLHVPIAGTVGAGDTFLCGYLYGKSRGETDENALRMAVSFASAKIQMQGTDIPSFEKLVRDVDKVLVQKVEPA